jgi:hypothetical protein
MKGQLIKHPDHQFWMVEYEEIYSADNRHEVIKVNLQLHPDDVEKIHEWNQIFDSIEGRINSIPEVEFDIIEHQKLSGIVKYAKLR